MAKESSMLITATALVLGTCLNMAQAAAIKPEVSQAPPKAAEPVDARTAFYEMYKPARSWASDVLPLTLASGDAPNIKDKDGKFGKWIAVFVSPSRHEARTFTYTVGLAVTAGAAETWSGATTKSRPFQLIEFTVSSCSLSDGLQRGASLAQKSPWQRAGLFSAQ